MVTVRWKKGKALGSEEGKNVRREVEQDIYDVEEAEDSILLWDSLPGNDR
jgi:hypothetical protein